MASHCYDEDFITSIVEEVVSTENGVSIQDNLVNSRKDKLAAKLKDYINEAVMHGRFAMQMPRCIYDTTFFFIRPVYSAEQEGIH